VHRLLQLLLEEFEFADLLLDRRQLFLDEAE
jgi:hypothetical protein